MTKTGHLCVINEGKQLYIQMQRPLYVRDYFVKNILIYLNSFNHSVKVWIMIS